MVPERAFLLESELFYRCFSRVLLKAQNSCCFSKTPLCDCYYKFYNESRVFKFQRKKDMNVANSN